jgi:ubiquinol-cytochrome c reductase iron-sulfur subunit
MAIYVSLWTGRTSQARLDTPLDAVRRIPSLALDNLRPTDGFENGETLVSHAEDHEGTRRDFLYYATAGAGTVTAGAAIWPLVDQMNPSADVQALSSIRVDVSGLSGGSQMTVKWLGKPVFIRRRTEPEIEAARSVDLADLPDNAARNANIGDADGSDANRTLDEAGEWLVQIGVCTHLGCVPLSNAGDYVLDSGVGGWFCPCHGSHYDTSGRIRKGPAPENLPVPIAEFVDETTIKLG